MCAGSSSGTTAAPGPKAAKARARLSIFRCQRCFDATRVRATGRCPPPTESFHPPTCNESRYTLDLTMLKPILLVEDNPRDLELTLLALDRSQLANEVIVARDGQEAIDYLHGAGDWAGRIPGNPAVILLDLKLPKIDGLEVLGMIRSSDTLKAVPVVMLTSSREERDLVGSYALGGNGYVVKPVEFNEFVQAIADLGVFWAVLNEPPPGSTRLRRQFAPE